MCACEGGTNADANMDWTCSQGRAVQPLRMQYRGAQDWEQRSCVRAKQGVRWGQAVPSLFESHLEGAHCPSRSLGSPGRAHGGAALDISSHLEPQPCLNTGGVLKFPVATLICEDLVAGRGVSGLLVNSGLALGQRGAEEAGWRWF